MKPPKKGPFLDGNRPQTADWLNAIVGESADWLNAIVGVFADWLNAIVSESADWLNAILLSPRAWIGLGIGQDQVPVKHSAALEGNRLACIEETKWRAVERNRAAQQHCREARHIGEISTEESTASGGAGEKGEPDAY